MAVEGDPNHPINRGALCAKGSALLQLARSDRRVTRVLYRSPKAGQWEEKSWDWAIARIAERIQATRDATWEPADARGRAVHRTEAIGVLGGASLTNEECYLLGKLARGLGVVAVEHQARLGACSALAALEATLGCGAMPNPWTDLAHADCIVVAGANPAENQPVAMRWIEAARRRGARLIVVDPRLTRTAAVADLHVPLRAGTDIALWGAVIHLLLEHGWIDVAYLARNTDAGLRIDPAYPLDPAGPPSPADPFLRDAAGRVLADPALNHEQCVLQALRRHFARYTPERAAEVCGTPPAKIEQLAEWFGATHAQGKAGTVVAGMGCLQHASSLQGVRALAILQLLLGNVGVAGGGVNALQGPSNGQGAIDHGLLSDRLPGQLPAPGPDDTSLGRYRERLGSPADAAAAVSLLRAYWGSAATPENDFCFGWLPRPGGDCRYAAMFQRMTDRQMRGLLVFGQNPAVSGADASRGRAALERLDWLVVADLWETETAAFWKRPGADPAAIDTEVFLLPAANVFEKEGSATGASRWAQWRPIAVAPAGEALADLEILNRLAGALRERYAAAGVFPEPIRQLAWDYARPADAHRVAREVNGQFQQGEPVSSRNQLRDDGSTSAGNALYCGSYVGDDNRMARRGDGAQEGGVSDEPPWAWTWPDDRRTLFAQADHGSDGIFERLPQGRARLFVPGLPGGPWPEHREPLESPAPGLTIAQSAESASGEFPVVAMLVGVGEHWASGAVSRNLPWLVELVPCAFVEIGRELAAANQIAHGDTVTIRSARGEITLQAVVTPRLQRLTVAGRPVDQVAIVSQFGYQGLATGPVANDLAPAAGDPVSGCPSSKAFLCQIERTR